MGRMAQQILLEWSADSVCASIEIGVGCTFHCNLFLYHWFVICIKHWSAISGHGWLLYCANKRRTVKCLTAIMFWLCWNLCIFCRRIHLCWDFWLFCYCRIGCHSFQCAPGAKPVRSSSSMFCVLLFFLMPPFLECTIGVSNSRTCVKCSRSLVLFQDEPKETSRIDNSNYILEILSFAKTYAGIGVSLLGAASLFIAACSSRCLLPVLHSLACASFCCCCCFPLLLLGFVFVFFTCLS